ncbi:MAG: transcriptional repressor [Candidatus Omnitrophica bacterium]|nr:transcriptional repressor [Candidatus Omnitrophota bacterium]
MIKNQRDKFQALLADQELKCTFERKTIFDEVLKLDKHFDADSLYERFKKKGLRISRDTVYRTIPLLLESGVIQKSVGAGKRDFFERTSARGHHDHMVCIRCHKFIEFHSDEIETLQEKLCGKYGFKLVFHDHRLFGICKQCSK